MKIDYLNEINSPLFEGITPGDLEKLLNCVNACLIDAVKGEVLLHEQDNTANIGVLLKGELWATKLDPSGRQFIVSQHLAGSVYGDILSLNPGQKSPVTVTAHTDAAVLLIPVMGILNHCERDCECHNKLIHNMLRTVSDKYFELQERLICIIRPSLREKLLFYLKRTAAHEGARTFNIPFDRAALSEYLNAERSALSRELSAMKRDGIIDYYKNTFRLL